MKIACSAYFLLENYKFAMVISCVEGVLFVAGYLAVWDSVVIVQIE